MDSASGKGKPKSQHAVTLAEALEELPKCQRVVSTWEPVGTVASETAALQLKTSQCHQCGQDAKVAMAGILLGVNHISLCKVCCRNMFSQVSAARPLATWLLQPLFVRFKVELEAALKLPWPFSFWPLMFRA